MALIQPDPNLSSVFSSLSEENAKPRVCLLLLEEQLFDQRVIGEIDALSEAGYNILLLMPHPGQNSIVVENRGSFRIARVPALQLRLTLLARLCFTSSWHRAFNLIDANLSTDLPVHLEEYQPLENHQAQNPGVPVAIKDDLKHKAIRLLKRGAHWGTKALGIWRTLEQSRLLVQEAAFIRVARAFAPHIVHANDLPTLRVGRELKRELKCALVYDAHEWYPRQADLRPDIARFWMRREREDIRYPDVHLMVNRPLAQVMARSLRMDIAKWTILHNLSPRVTWSADKSAWERERQLARPQLMGTEIEADSCLLLSVCFLNDIRGIDKLIEAMTLLPESYKLTLIGDGSQRLRLEALRDQLGLQSRVTFLGFKSREEIPKLCTGADIGLVSQQPRGINAVYCSPNRISDYVQAGLIMAVSDLPFLRDFVTQNKCGATFDSRDPISIATTIRTLWENRESFESQRMASLETGTYFNWDVEKNVFLSLYENLLSRKRAN